jgi:hypothetical protein
MPDNQYEYKPFKNLTDFEKALDSYLLRGENQTKHPWWAGGAFRDSPLIGSWPFPYEDPIVDSDRLYFEIMDIVKIEGFHPGIVDKLSPEAQKVYMGTVGPRLGRSYQEQYAKRLQDYATETGKAANQSYNNYLKWGEGERAEAWRRYEAELNRSLLPYQQYQTDLEQWRWEQEFAREGQQWQQQLQWAKDAAAGAQAQVRLAGRFGGGTSEPRRSEQELFEAARQEILGSLQGPRDWIQRWNVESKPNPYADIRDRTSSEKVAGAQENLKQAKELLKEFKDAEKAAASDPNRTLTFEEKQLGEVARQMMQTNAGIITRELGIDPAGDAGIDVGSSYSRFGGGTEIIGGRRRGSESALRPEPQPTTPETPSWLQALYPEMGANIEKMPVMPLSGQWMSRLSPSQLQGWAGYVDWAGEGQTPEQLLWQTQRQLPRTPRTAQRWTPARQR